MVLLSGALSRFDRLTPSGAPPPPLCGGGVAPRSGVTEGVCQTTPIRVLGVTPGARNALSQLQKTLTVCLLYETSNATMVEVRQTEDFESWFAVLRDREARARITARIRRLSLGNPGDVKPVGSGVSEMRIDYGPGYRVYFVRRGDAVVVLLCGGDKKSQDRDIANAIEIARELD